MNIKLICFEYIIYRLLDWYRELRPLDSSYVSFTRLKILKLLFFVAAIRENKEMQDLLDIFNNFYAMQHGPVESDIYNAMVNSELKYYSFKSRSIEINGCINENCFDTLDKTIRNRVDISINLLRRQNQDIVTYTASQLVNLSHKWDSWQLAMHMAEVLGKGSEPMDINTIQSNRQYYSI